jgi:hypothetical protein
MLIVTPLYELHGCAFAPPLAVPGKGLRRHLAKAVMDFTPGLPRCRLNKRAA